MSSGNTIKINFRGGIISPGDLYNIMVAATKSGIRYVSFGLRQQLLINVFDDNNYRTLRTQLDSINIRYETNENTNPNIISSYPAADVFMHNSWLSEGVYKDVFDGIDYEPQLKINISDSNQSFTPLFTGNINWVAANNAAHYWHLFIRFPKTNTIYQWSEMVYTNDVPRLSKEIEHHILENTAEFYDNPEVNGEALVRLIEKEKYITKTFEGEVKLPPYNLPYYEGVNRYNNGKCWIGVYRRDELFHVDFLKEVAMLCLDTKIGQFCSTPWKSIIVKGIEEKDRERWSRILDKYHLNVRHAANELNFQVEDNCKEGLELKKYLMKKLNDEDIRTFGLCIGIKTKRKSEVYSSVLVRRKPLIRIFGFECCYLYDILCANDFNPNERTGFVFSCNNPKFWLAEQLRRSILLFYQQRAGKLKLAEPKAVAKTETEKPAIIEYVYQCNECLTVYDEQAGEPIAGIEAGTKFKNLPDHFACPLCETGKENFTKISKEKLGLHSV